MNPILILFLILLLILLAAELILRFYEHLKHITPHDIKDYPFYYKFHKKNSYGRHEEYANRTIGVKNTPMIRTYSEGIRGDIADEKRKIVLCLGCSFTEGGALRDEETWPGYLQKMLDPDEYGVINAGIGGYGIFQISRLLQQLIKYSPKIVIVQLFDFKRLPLDARRITNAKKYFLLKENLKKISILLFYFFSIIREPEFQNVLAPYYWKHKSFKNKKLWELNRKYLDEIRDVCKKNNTTLLIFHWRWVEFSSPKKPEYFWQNKFLKKYCAENHIFTCDVNKFTEYSNQNELEISPAELHPNAMSNKLVAKAIYNCLKTNKLAS
ncbi:MAG: GDSL-type esterase/lipase family protein [Candidatus Staskawiczbacteria bacterium]